MFKRSELPPNVTQDALPRARGSRSGLRPAPRLLWAGMVRLGWLGGLVILAGTLPLEGLVAASMGLSENQNAVASPPSEAHPSKPSVPHEAAGNGVSLPPANRSSVRPPRRSAAPALRRRLRQRVEPGPGASVAPSRPELPAAGIGQPPRGQRRSTAPASGQAAGGRTQNETNRRRSTLEATQPSRSAPPSHNQAASGAGAGQIDRSADYNLGATRRRVPQETTVQFADRASGCQTTASGGGLSRACGGNSASSRRFRSIDRQQLGGARPSYADRFRPEGSLPETSATGGNRLPVDGFPTRLEPGDHRRSRLAAQQPGETAVQFRQRTGVTRQRGGALPYQSPSGILSRALSAGANGVTFNASAYYFRSERPPGVFGNGNATAILPLTISAPLASGFGWRMHPILGYQRFHAGADFSAPQGTPVVAAWEGRVETAGWMGGYGLAVLLNHGDRQTLYGHLSEIFVQAGATIRQGETLGRVGTTGLSTGPHLHFEVHERTAAGWVARNPVDYLGSSQAQVAFGRPSSGLPAPLPVSPLPMLPGLGAVAANVPSNLPLQPVAPLPAALPGQAVETMMMAAIAAVEASSEEFSLALGAQPGTPLPLAGEPAERVFTEAEPPLPVASSDPSPIISLMPAPAMAIE